MSGSENYMDLGEEESDMPPRFEPLRPEPWDSLQSSRTRLPGGGG